MTDDGNTDQSLYVPVVDTTAQLSLSSNMMRLIIPSALAPTHTTEVIGTSTSISRRSNTTTEIKCHVCRLQGSVKEVVLSSQSRQQSDLKVVKMTDNKYWCGSSYQ